MVKTPQSLLLYRLLSKDLPKAIQTVCQVVSIQKSISDLFNLVVSYGLMGLIYKESGDEAKSQKAFRKAFNLASSTRHPRTATLLSFIDKSLGEDEIENVKLCS